ncbi:MAG: FixH family protein [Chloroflexota bacterium]
MSRLTLSFIAAVLLVLATSGAALAKCPEGSTEEQCQGMAAEIDISGSIQAGTETTVGLWLTYDGRPVTDTTSVELVFARAADGTVLRFPAAPTGSDGRYTAQVLLPAGGYWNIATEVRTPDGTYGMPLETRQVTPLPAGPTTGTPVSSPAPVTVPIWLAGALVLAMLGGAIGIAALGLRRPATA